MKRPLSESDCGCWICYRCSRGKWRRVIEFRVKDLTKLGHEAEIVGSNDNIAHLFLEDAWFGPRL